MLDGYPWTLRNPVKKIHHCSVFLKFSVFLFQIPSLYQVCNEQGRWEWCWMATLLALRIQISLISFSQVLNAMTVHFLQ